MRYKRMSNIKTLFKKIYLKFIYLKIYLSLFEGDASRLIF